MENAKVKLSILSQGVAISENTIANYKTPFLAKRRVYGNQDPVSFINKRIPQEFYLLPDKLIVSANINPNSSWTLDYQAGKFFLQNKDGQVVYTDFPLEPKFYDSLLTNNKKVSQIVTLYGGSSLGMFVYGNCDLIQKGYPCQFCSLHFNRTITKDFPLLLSLDEIREAVTIAIKDETLNLTQIMVNGGIIPNIDNNFEYYLNVIEEINNVLLKENKNIEIHLITFPPSNLELLKTFGKYKNVKVAINTEVYDDDLFARYCPGKHKSIGKNHIYHTLFDLVKIMGAGKVYSILVGGLEPLDTLEKGLFYLAENGVTPVINVFHPDPGTALEYTPRPTFEYLIEAGKMLQSVYKKYNLIPFYENCGRNALDTEAYRGLF
jgi:uncharacterized radical SAM superfamily protein